MWEKLFSLDLIAFMKLSDEEEPLIQQFFTELENKLMYSEIKSTILKWHTYDELHQIGLAIYHVGEFHASRFMMFMDFHSLKYQEGSDDYEETRHE